MTPKRTATGEGKNNSFRTKRQIFPPKKLDFFGIRTPGTRLSWLKGPMGSMYMGHVLLAEEGRRLLTSNLMKYWILPDPHSRHVQHRHVVSCSSCRATHCATQDNIISDDGDNNNNNGADCGGQQTASGQNMRVLASEDVHDGSLSQSFAKMDYATLTRLGWTCAPLTSHPQDGRRGQRSRSAPPKNAGSVVLRSRSVTGEHADRTNLTKEEYRRLTEQVRDVDSIIRNKFRRPASGAAGAWNADTSTEIKVPKSAPVVPLEPAIHALNSGSSSSSGSMQGYFQASRLPFHVRRWRRDGLSESPAQRCRPSTSRPRTLRASSSSLTTTSRTQPRPRSTPAYSIERYLQNASADGPCPFPKAPPARLKNDAQEDGDFNSLSPQLISQLLDEAVCLPMTFPDGDSSLTRAGETQGGRDKSQSKGSINDDLSTTSGVESDGGEDEADDVSEEEVNDEADNDDSSDSDNDGFEPSLDDLRKQLPNPRSLFPLRPEKLDAVNSLEDQREMQEVDFDVKLTNPPLYEFRYPLPDFLHKIDLRRCARERSNWRDEVGEGDAVAAGGLQGLVDRLVQLEKFQYVTEDWEAKKPQRARLRRQEKSLQNNNSAGSRAASGRQRDRRCTCPCLQATCPGNCLEKRLSSARCPSCGQPSCSGACQESRERRSRHFLRGQDHQDFGDHVQAASSGSSSSKASSLASVRRPKTRLISASHLSQSRPRSSAFSETRSKSASGRPRDFRPASAVSIQSSLVSDFECLSIYQPVSRSRPSYSKPRSPYVMFSDKTAKFHSKISGAEPFRDKKTKTIASLRVLRGSS